jgi:hypothetical protein
MTKYQILNDSYSPLCWEGKPLVFDEFQTASSFLENIYDTDPIDPMETHIGLKLVPEDVECINATNLKPIYLEDDYNMALIDAETEEIIYI